MNFLAHMLLAGEIPEHRLGNFIADHVKGKAIETYSPLIREGIIHHRKIDTFTDTHEVFLHTVSVIRPELGRYSAVAADMFYDHFLAKYWQNYSDENRLAFTHKVYASLQPFHEQMPAGSQKTFEYMTYRNWLYNYADIPFLNRCFRGLDQRAAFSNRFLMATTVLVNNYDILRSDFRKFMPIVIEALGK